MKTTKPILAILLLVFILSESFSQDIARQSINSFGKSTYTAGIRISETAGQPYFTLTQANGALVFHPGFQQQMIAGKKEITIAGDQLSIEFYPNPASSFIMILPSTAIAKARITVVDMNGKVISTTEHDRLESATMDVSAWTSGLYTIRVIDTKTRKQHPPEYS